MAGAVAIIVIGGTAIAIGGLPRTKKTLEHAATAVRDKAVEVSQNNRMQQANEKVRTQPEDASVWADRAHLNSQNGKSDEAIKDYTRAIALQPNEPMYYYERGVELHRANQSAKAVEDYTKGIELDPKNASAYGQRALFYCSLNKTEAAFYDYTKAMKLTESDMDRDFYKGQRASLLSGLASQYQIDRKYAKALEVLARWIKLEPEDENAFVQRAQLYEAMKQPQKAKSDYAQALKVISSKGPETSFAFEDQGNLYEKLGNIDAAKNSWRRALALFQEDEKDETSFFYNSGDVIFNYDAMVHLCEKVGDLEGAARIREKQLEIHHDRIQEDPEMASNYVGRATTYEAMHKYDAALADYVTAIKLDPDPENYRSRAEVFYQLKNYQQAINDLLACLASVKNDRKGEDYSKLAKLYEILGRHDDALKAANQSIADDAKAAEGYYWRARAEKSTGKNEAAQVDFQKANQLRPPVDFSEGETPGLAQMN